MNDKLDKAREARLRDQRKIAQIQKLVTNANLNRFEIHDFVKYVFPDSYCSVVDYIATAPIADVRSLLVDVICLSIEDTSGPVTIYSCKGKDIDHG